MKDSLITAINEISNNKSLFTLDEASIKSGIILKFLSLLGWDPFNINEVKPEYTIESKRVDFSLRITGINKVFIEVKRPSENLEQHQEQLLNYSFREGVKLSVLTNGLTWWFYLPLHEGSWEQRRFFAADFFEQDVNAIANRFVELLSKSNIDSGVAIEKAENLYKSRQKKTVLKEALPKAWDKIINDPDDLLVELLIETTEKISGFRPDVSNIEKFLGNLHQGTASIEESRVIPSAQTEHSGVPQRHPRSQATGYINKKVHLIELLGKTYHPHSWKEVLIIVSKEMFRRHASDFDKCLVLRGSRMAYFSLNSNELSQPVNISDSKYFIETKLNANSIVKRSLDLMGLFGYKDSDLIIQAQ